MSHHTHDLLAIGRSSLDLYAHEIGVPITAVRSFDAYIGGCPTNVSVGARRLGLRSALLSAVGDDQVGDFVLHVLRSEGVDTFIPRKAGRRTSAVILTIQPPDRFPLTFYRDNCADRALTIDDVCEAPVAESRVIFLTGTGVSHEPSRGATFFAAERARQAGRDVIVDLDYRPDQWGDGRAFGPTVCALLRLADLAIGTEDEVRAAGESDDLDEASASLLATGIEALVLKRGERGSAILRRDGSRADVAPFQITVLNVLGAGDAFASGLIYGRLQGWPLERAARLGNAAGAIVASRHGCATFMPTLVDLEELIATQGGWECPQPRA